MSEPLEVRLEPLETSLTELSFAANALSEISQWAAELPLANIGETATQLNLATAELALLDAPAEQKFEALEALRPLLHYTCSRIDRRDFTAAKSTRESQAQRLLLNLCTGYKGVVLESIAEDENGNLTNKPILSQAIHRLISELSRILLRSQQLYMNPPPNFWWELNELYRLSEVVGIAGFTFVDDENHTDKPITIRSAYLRALLLASCKPNQLQQAQLSQVFSALESWTEVVQLSDDLSEGLLVVDLLANSGPTYTKIAEDAAAPRGLHTEVLAYEIEAFLSNVDGHIKVPPNFPPQLLRHLLDTWSVMHDRAFERFPTNVSLRVAVGLRAVHYFLSGGCLFKDQLSNTDERLRREINPFLELDYESSAYDDDSDPWAQAHDLKVRMPVNPNIETPEDILLNTAQEEANQRSYDHFETIALDSSPGGYRMEWRDALPSNAAVGELIALREERANRWCVAVIRWLRHEGKRISMGVELLSPRAIPVAVRAIQKIGGPTDYARALLLPEIQSINQIATLLTPRLPFEEGQKINIQRQGIQSTGQLVESQLKTESFNQFTFRMLDGYLENVRSDSNIDSLAAMTREDTSQGS
jgi:hypothetical protein